ncbi:hypothetical protein [Streptomyces sp. NBC_01185]|uniref:hypothetical protein n=1 Tax=Streptomyces sp. NBC_01185 TaxID=2903764 RepID=UPI00386C60E8|nr:hypothetical protein OG770_24250 [Streptomyces sp. NBC_01185]
MERRTCSSATSSTSRYAAERQRRTVPRRREDPGCGRGAPDAVDAGGRHGVEVARYDAYNPGVRDELIFDRKTLELIGVRSVATKATDTIEAGQVLGTTAILQRAVVDTKGKRPYSG